MLAGLTVADDNMTAADQVGLFFAQPLPGHATLVIDFSYNLVQKDTGFHLDPYAAADGMQYIYAATHMEVRAMCHDTPAADSAREPGLTQMWHMLDATCLAHMPACKETALDMCGLWQC